MARRTKAWLTPDTGDTSVVRGCLEIPAPLLPMVTGALSALTEVWNWQAFGTMTPEDAAEAATRMLFAFEDGTCSDMNCEDVLDCVLPYLQANLYDDATIRLEPTTERPQVSYDGGTTWTDIPQTGNGTISAPQPQPTPGANDNAKICLASTRAALVLAEFYKQTFGAFTADVMNALGTANSFLQDIKLVLFNAIYSPYDGIVEAAGFLEQDFETNYTAGELSSGNMEDLLCLLANNASVDASGVVTFDFGAIADNVIADVGANPGTAIWFLLQNMQSAGLNAAASTAITDTPLDCSPCGLECDQDCTLVTTRSYAAALLPNVVPASSLAGGEPLLCIADGGETWQWNFSMRCVSSFKIRIIQFVDFATIPLSLDVGDNYHLDTNIAIGSWREYTFTLPNKVQANYIRWSAPRAWCIHWIEITYCDD